jgi:hypothetical protein
VTSLRRAARAAPQVFLAALLLGLLCAQSASADPAPPTAAQPVPQPAPGPTVPAPGPTPQPAPGPTPVPGPQRVPSPGPTPGLIPPACQVTHTACTTGGGLGDLFDIPGMIVNAITAFLGMLVEQIMEPLRELLASTLLATPDVTQQADIKQLWTGSLGIAAGIYGLFITAGGITVMGYETVQTAYALKQIAPRLLLGMLAAATSLTVLGKAIALANALSRAVMGTDLSSAGQGLVERVIPFALFGTAGLKVYLLLLAVLVIVLVVAVLLGYLVRVALIAVLAISAPLALSCHAHPATDGVARLWWRAVAATLAIQIVQSMTFIVALKLFFAPGATLLGFPKPNQLGTLLAGLALFWVLFKIPGWCARAAFRATPITPQLPGAVRMVHSVAMWRLINHAMPGVSFPRRGPGRSTGRGGGGGGRPGGAGPRGGGGGGRPPQPAPGGIAGAALRRSQALATGFRARGTRPGSTTANPSTPRLGPASSPGPGSGAPGGGTTPAPGGPTPSSSARLRPARGPSRTRPLAGTATSPASPPARPARKGPRFVMHPAQARRAQQLTLPIPTKRNPARGSRAVQTWLPIRAERLPAPPQTARATPGAPPRPARMVPGAVSPAARPAPVQRARQLALPVPAKRVRVRPPRPLQLRLPLEPPRPRR